MADEIDWSKLRARLRETPIVVKPKHVKHPNRSPESLEKRREGASRAKRAAWQKAYKARKKAERLALKAQASNVA